MRCRYNVQRNSSLACSAAVRSKSSLWSNLSSLSLILSESPLNQIPSQYTLYQREVIYFIDKAVLEFRRTRLTKENIQPNISYLRSKVQIGRVKEYFKPAYNCLHSKVLIGHIGEYFEPAHNYICSKVWIGRIGEYLEPIRNH